MRTDTEQDRRHPAWQSLVLPAVISLILVSGVAAQDIDIADAVRQATGITNGLCVQVDFSSPDMMKRLANSGQFIVHGMSARRDSVTAARKSLAAEGLTGLVTIGLRDQKSIPVVNDLVNLLVVEDLPTLLSGGTPATEIARVLSPGGAACLGVTPAGAKTAEEALAQTGLDFKQVKAARTWLVCIKTRPAGMDEWTHQNHGPDQNAVSKDRLIGPPDTVRWHSGPTQPTPRPEASPAYAQPSQWISAGGRNFYLMNNNHVVARSGYNGLLLWTAPVGSAFPPYRRLLAAHDRIYVANSKEILVLDPATGAVIRKLPAQASIMMAVSNRVISVNSKQISCLDPNSGTNAWSISGRYDRPEAYPPAVAGSRLFIAGPCDITAVDVASGTVAWKVDLTATAGTNARLVFAHADMLFCRRTSGPKECWALSTADGHALWKFVPKPPPPQVWTVTDETFLAGGLIWVNECSEGRNTVWRGIKPADGTIAKTLPSNFGGAGCHTMRMTDLFAIGKRPCNFESWEDGKVYINGGARGACGLSIGLANGQFYNLQCNVPSGCVCGPFVTGVAGWASDKSNPVVTAENRLEKVAEPPPALGDAKKIEAPWPMFRHDAKRSSTTSNSIPDILAIKWTKKLETGRWPDSILRQDWTLHAPSSHLISGPTLAGGRVFVSLTELGVVTALDENDGKVLWSYAAGGRLDTPPGIVDGICLLGCRDGSVSGLDVANGNLLWRFMAAPNDRRMLDYAQMESSWPVVGGVLLEGGIAYVVAGRSTEVDEGLFIHAFDPRTGQPTWSRRRPLPATEKVANWNIYRGTSDILASDGAAISIGGSAAGKFDPKTGAVPQERGLPKFNVPVQARFNYVKRGGGGNYAPCPVAFNEAVACRPFVKQEGKPVVFSSAISVKPHGQKTTDLWNATFQPNTVIESVVIAGDKVVVALTISNKDKRGGELHLFSLKDGTKISTLVLPSAPVFEGLAVAEGKVFASLENGTVLCLAATP